MMEVMQVHVENEAIPSATFKDLKTDSNEGENPESHSPTEEPIRERGSTITKKIPLSEFATLQGILAHQVDEGAPCLKCGPGICDGLDLHFWKKVCKNCGCPRGSHKIQKLIEEKKEVPRPILIQTADEDEEDYKELEVSAPPTKTTIRGKPDTQDSVKYNQEYITRLREFYRHKAAALDLPDYKKLSPEEQILLQHYINQTQGHELVSTEAVQNHLNLLAKASTASSDQHHNLDASDGDSRDRCHSSASSDSDISLQLLQALQLLNLNNRGNSPGDRAASVLSPDKSEERRSGGSRTSSEESGDEEIPTVEMEEKSRQESAPPPPIPEKQYPRPCSSDNASPGQQSPLGSVSPGQPANGVDEQIVGADDDRHDDASTPKQSDGMSRKYPREVSDSSEEESRGPPLKPLRRNPGSFEDMSQGDIAEYYTNVNPSGDYPGSHSLPRTGSPGVWVPPNIDNQLVKQYLAALPEDKRPVNTVGVQWRIKQLQTQLPRYDHNINYCHEMSPDEQEEMFMFVESRKNNAQGQGEVKSFKKKSKKKCEKCGGFVECGVMADKVPGRVWHPGCFSCNTCDEILVDLIYFQYDGRLYCGRHHAELLRPRCHACDELIFGHEFITADKHEYHREHFCCWECDASLGGTKYVSHNGQPYCQGCFESLFCMRCVSCRDPIGVGVPVYRHGSLRWHGNAQCYSCSFCKTSLVNRTFMPTDKHVYCSKNCYRCHESLRKTKNGQ